MLKHYITYYPNTDKLKTFRQTWKGKDDRYEEYYENGKLSLEQIWDGDIWVKIEYDKNGRMIKSEDSTGFWWKYTYDENGNEVYYENSDGFWSKREYDENGNQIHYKNGSKK